MNKINKILIISIVFGCGLLNFALAQSLTDCGIFAKEVYSTKNGFPVVEQRWEVDNWTGSNFLTVEQQRLILTKNDLNTALLNLKKYCCEKDIGGISSLTTCDLDKASFNKNAMDSQYLFDHIFDVIMRRLNGLTGDVDVYESNKMKEVDDKGKERREFMNDKAEDLEGSDAQSIIDEYQKYWKKSNPNLGYDITDQINRTFAGATNDQDFLRAVARENGDVEGKTYSKVALAMQNYDKWTLYDRYNNACALTKYFYSLLQVGDNSDRGVIVDRLAKGACEDLIESQIKNENNYVQTVVQNSANLFTENYIEGYMQYLYDRSTKLKSMWKNAENRWVDVIRAVPYLLKNCVK